MGNVICLAGRDQPAGILLVERDPLVRIATVVEAIDGSEALKLLRAWPDDPPVFGARPRVRP